MSSRKVVITGIGMVSSLGEGWEQNWRALNAAPLAANVDSERFAPYSVHPLPEIDWSTQIAKRGDLRQMDAWQRLGVHTAGLALDDAGMKGDEALCGTMDMIVAAAGGERDIAVDEAILEAARTSNDRDVMLNEKLTTELRPTLFLAQLSNLMAGNVSIVHKVTGSSRTFMGEEGSGIAAVEDAAARIRSGQSSHVLVGAAHQTEGMDFLLTVDLGQHLHRGAMAPLWQRAESAGGGVVLGSASAFLVLEEEAHARARGARIYAAIDAVVSDQVRRDQASYAGHLADLFSPLLEQAHGALLVSGASGADFATAAEAEALQRFDGFTLRSMAAATGHLKEAQLPFAVALAALAVHHGKAYPQWSPDHDSAEAGTVTSAVATAVGFNRAEGAARIVKA
ncbi:MAG: beta-ketoacyl-ACP synthase [Rhizobiaceae bacterium]